MEEREQMTEERERILERYELVTARIREIVAEETVAEPFRDYFYQVGQFLLLLMELKAQIESGAWEDRPLSDWQAWNEKLYEDILPKHYEESYGNPAWAVRKLGEKVGRLLSCFYTELRGGIAYVTEGRLLEFTAGLETFVELYNLFESCETREELEREIESALYYFFSDYSDVTMDYRVREQLDPSLTFAKKIILKSGTEDFRYLYEYREYISESELQTARYLASLPQETVEAMARTYTEGYRRGFELAGKPLHKKKQVELRYSIGFERVMKEAIRQFAAMGLAPTICRPAVNLMSKSVMGRSGYLAAPANPQFDYDHRYDMGLFLDKALKERRISVIRHGLESRKELAARMGGPALLETFGEKLFEPENKPEAASFTEKQNRLYAQMQAEASRLMNQYLKGEERSFTIISYPIPEIGPDFEAIFRETIALNNLDVTVYEKVQKTLIDGLDRCETVHITGRNGNRTDLTIALAPLSDPEKETKFENCLADVNIPLGEVFTSPRLTGTEGILHVKEVYIRELRYENLEFHIKNGRTEWGSCTNFPSQKENEELVKGTILFHHDSLPMGEFAIGTNTTAYRMAKNYHIFDKLKILIAEKTGPHFAFGDTCYSNAEDLAVYNPDGKEMIARDNEVTLLRKTEPEKAYFGCHTDVTIPYDELDEIIGFRKDGEAVAIMKNGRFVLPGTELLNDALEGLEYEEETK